MGLILGIIGIIITILLSLCIAFANGMSDAPSQKGISILPGFIIGMLISISLIITHYYPIHFSW